MPQNTTISIPPQTWVLLTETDSPTMSFQILQSLSGVHLKGAVGETTPADIAGSFVYNQQEGEYGITLAEMFPGLSATRLYVWSQTQASIMVSES